MNFQGFLAKFGGNFEGVSYNHFTMQRFLLILTYLVLSLPISYAQSCMLVELPLKDRVQTSTLIVEGEVVGRVSFANNDGTLINTAHEVKVYTLFKGQLQAQRIYVVTQGGRLGQQLQVVAPSLQLAPGDKGLFLLHPAHYEGQPSLYKVYQPVGGPQGFVRYAKDGTASDPFTVYTSILQQVKAPVRQWSAQIPATIQPKPRQRLQGQRGAVPVISSFSPSTVSAGTIATLTITGSGFGTQTGQAEVAFANANDGGATFIPAPTSFIQSWSNTQIVVQVPMDAGTGPIRVTDASGASVTSANSLTIPYSVLNLDVNGTFYRTYLRDINGSGGLTLQYNTNFVNYPAAQNAFERALTTWRCGTGLNFDISNINTSIACNGQDGISVVNWDTACSLPQGVLGVTRSNFSFCTSPLNIYLDDVDLIFAKTPAGSLSWNFGPGNATNNEFDFESTALHELGHAHQMTHVINTNGVMHYNLNPGVERRVLSSQDIAGGNDIISFSNTASCGPNPHTPLSSGNCTLGSPTAQFVGVPQQGCAPLEVFFFDQSSGNPTSWQWDIDNDGIIDYTSKNISHTYTQAGTYAVTLIVGSSGGTDTLTQNKYIEVAPSLQVDGGVDEVLCAGQTIALQASATGGSGSYRYEWQPANGTLSNTQIPDPVASPVVTTTYTVTVTDSFNCQASDSVTITVAPLPVANAGNSQQVCSGSSVVLGGQPAGSGGTGPLTYQWIADQLTIPSVPNPTVVPVQSQIFTLQVSDSLGCRAQDTVSVVVNQPPKVDAGTNVRLCAGQSVQIGGQPTASGGTGSFTYVWRPNVNINNIALPNPTVAPTSTTVYTVQVFDNLGCTTSDTIVVQVLPPVEADAGQGGQLCFGATDTLGGMPTGLGGSPPLSYNWSPSTGLTNTSVPNPVATITQNITYTLVVNDRNNCRAVDSVTYSVLPAPVADAGPDRGVCDGLTGTVTIGGNPAGSGGTAPLTYQWAPATGLNDPTLPNPISQPGQQRSYTLTVTDANGCVDNDTMVVAVNPPLVARAGTRDSVCAGTCITLGLTPSAIGGDGNYSYAWAPSGSLNDSALANPTACPPKSTTYTLHLTDGKGCTSSDTVRVILRPAPTVQMDNIDSLYCENDGAVTLTGTPANGVFAGPGVSGNTFDPGVAGIGLHTISFTFTNSEGCTSVDSQQVEVAANPVKPVIFVRNDTLFTDTGFAGYQWLFNGISIANANDYFLYRPSGQLDGDYEVIVTNDAGCQSRSDIFTYTDVPAVWAGVSVSLQPNPTSAAAYIQIQTANPEELVIQVFDLQGKMVRMPSKHVVNGQLRVLLPVEDWAAGIYLVSINGRNGQRQLPLVVQ